MLRLRGILLGVMLGAAAVAVRAEPRLVNYIVAVVNEKVITRMDVEQQAGDRENVLKMQYGRQPQVLQQKMDEALRDSLDSLIDRALILHEFRSAGYKLPSTAIDEQIKMEIRERYGDRARFIRTLQREGMTYDTYKKRKEEDFIVMAMVRKNISSEIIISPYKIEQHYAQNLARYQVEDEVKLRVIYLANKPDRNAAATQRLAAEIEVKLAAGATFAEMASTYSDLYRNDGGDFGWKQRKELSPELADKLFAMKPGERTGVMVEPNGCRIIMVEDSRGARTRPLSEVFPEIEGELMMKLRQDLQKAWLERLKAKAYIKLIPAA